MNNDDISVLIFDRWKLIDDIILDCIIDLHSIVMTSSVLELQNKMTT